MAAFQHLLQRLGFVKLDRFGLELTPDGRILSTRPAVLDDGAGGRIVGWEDRDLAAAELTSWQPVQNPALRAPARRFIAPSAPPPAPTRARPAAIPPAIPAASQAKPFAVQASAAVIPAAVAGEPVVDEDDWEWTIALARARAEDVSVDAPAAPPPPAAAKTLPMASVEAKEPAASAEWPATQPLGAIDYEDYAAVPTRPAIAIPRIAPPRPASVIPLATAPSTVIPVPALPTMRGTANATPLAPVVRTIPAQRRFPKGTGPHDRATRAAMAGPTAPTAPTAVIGEHTRLGVTPASASPVGDQTQVGLALPPAARAVALPSIKQRMSSR